MHSVKSWLVTGVLVAALAGSLGLPSVAVAAGKVSGTRFEMTIPDCWSPGYKDLDDKLFMIFFKDPKSGAVLEGVYLRGQQPASFTMADFKKARIAGEDKRYEGKGHKVGKDGSIAIGGEKGVYLHTHWKDGGKDMEKHTALYLKNGGRYLVVMSGEKGKVDKSVFDEAVKSFALVKP